MLPTPQAAAGQQASQKKTGCKDQSGRCFQAQHRKRRFRIRHHTSDYLGWYKLHSKKSCISQSAKTKILSKCAIESARKNVPFGSDNVQDLLGYYDSNSALNPLRISSQNLLG